MERDCNRRLVYYTETNLRIRHEAEGKKEIKSHYKRKLAGQSSGHKIK